MPSFRRHMYNKKTLQNNTPKSQQTSHNNNGANKSWPYIQSRDDEWLTRIAKQNDEPDPLQEED